MTSSDDFLQRYGPEGERVEYKSARKNVPRDFWETYSSFANTSGGTIILGVEEDQIAGTYEVTGVENPQHEMKVIWDTLNNPAKISANLLDSKDVYVENVDGFDVIIVEVPRADRRSRPVYLNGNMLLETYKRNHEGDYRCRQEVVHSMLRDSLDDKSDGETVDSLEGYDCLVMEDIERFVSMLGPTGHRNKWASQSVEEVLFTIGTIKSKNGIIHPTRAGLLMFGRISNILDEFPNFHLDYREVMNDERWSFRINSDSFNVDYNVFSFMMAVIGKLSEKIGSPFKLEGMRRQDESEAFIAIREAVVNALVHADYYGRGGISIIYDGDRVAVTNPGSLRIPLENAIRGGTSDPRNSNMMRMMLGIGLVEEIGAGIHSMFLSKDDGSLLNVSIEELADPERVRVVLTLPIQQISLTESESRILRYVSDNPHTTMKELSEAVGLSSRTVSRIVSELIDRGVIVRTGTFKNMTWMIKR